MAAPADVPEKAQATADKLADELAAALGGAIFSTNGETMEQVVGRRLKELGETVAVAESCTGGLIRGRFTADPPASAHFTVGATHYSNQAKIRTLSVYPC